MNLKYPAVTNSNQRNKHTCTLSNKKNCKIKETNKEAVKENKQIKNEWRMLLEKVCKAGLTEFVTPSKGRTFIKEVGVLPYAATPPHKMENGD